MEFNTDSIGTVISDQETPTFEIVRIKLKAGQDVKPGTLIRVPVSRDNTTNSTLIARVRSAREYNPHESPEGINVRDTLAMDPNYPMEEDSTTIAVLNDLRGFLIFSILLLRFRMVRLFQEFFYGFGFVVIGVYREQSRRSGTETGVSGSDDALGPQTRGDSSDSRGAVELHQYVEKALSDRRGRLFSLRL